MRTKAILTGICSLSIISCASLSLFSTDNPSRYSKEQQAQTIELLTKAEALLHTCLDKDLNISRIELTAAPDQELWHVNSCTGKEHSYRVSLLGNGEIGLQDIRSRRDIKF